MDELTCPKCGAKIDVGNNLPERACDDEYIDCEMCNAQIRFGWTAEIEIRSWK